MILLTGGSGFIGSHFHELFDQKNLIILDLQKPRFKHESKFYQGDICDPQILKTIFSNHKIDMVISLAAAHKDFGITREEYFRTNVEGIRTIMQEMTNHGMNKLVFYSSVAVYGGNKTPSSELMTPEPNNNYGASKLQAEKEIEQWIQANPINEAVIIRPAVVYGERNVANMFRLIHQIKKGHYFHIGKGDNIKSIAYVKNLVEATQFLIPTMKPGVEIFNYADNPQLTSREIAHHISLSSAKKEPITLPLGLMKILGLPFDFLIKVTGKDLPISTNRIVKFCTETFHKADKIKQYGFAPKYSNIEGLENMVQWQTHQFKDSDESNFDV